jgi:hypothetical protein
LAQLAQKEVFSAFLLVDDDTFSARVLACAGKNLPSGADRQRRARLLTIASLLHQRIVGF